MIIFTLSINEDDGGGRMRDPSESHTNLAVSRLLSGVVDWVVEDDAFSLPPAPSSSSSYSSSSNAGRVEEGNVVFKGRNDVVE